MAMSSVPLNTLRPCLAAAIQRSSTHPSYPAAGSDPSVGHVYYNESQQHYTPPPPMHGVGGGMFGGAGGYFGGQTQQPDPGMYGAGPPPGQGPSEEDKDREIDRLRRELKKAEEKCNFFRNQVMQLQHQVSSMDSSSVVADAPQRASEVEQLRNEILEERARGQVLQAQGDERNSQNRSDPAAMAALHARVSELEQAISHARSSAESTSASVPSPSHRGHGSSPSSPQQLSELNSAPSAARGDFLDPVQHPGGNKRAVIIGCNYPGQLGSLRAGVTDAQQWARFFTKRCNFAEADIRLLSDDPAHYQHKERPDSAVATRANIFRALQWLTSRSSSNDQLFFVFCGHGIQVLAEEFAGRKLCENAVAPTDVSADGAQPRVVSDTDVHQALLAVPSGAQATLIYDCCHAGQPLDRAGLNYLTDYVNRGKIDYEKLKGHPVLPRFLELPQWKVRPNPPEAKRESNLRCHAVQWAACSNAQFCVELPIEERSRGVFTYMFICALLKIGVHGTSASLLQEVQTLTAQLKGRWRLQQEASLSASRTSGDSQKFVKM